MFGRRREDAQQRPEPSAYRPGVDVEAMEDTPRQIWGPDDDEDGK